MKFARAGLLALMLGCGLSLSAASAKVTKVLPHFLDSKGRHTIEPSLYERDAYQVYLREHPNDIYGVRFDVQWKARAVRSKDLRLRLEVRGSNTEEGKPWVVSQALPRAYFFAKWSPITLSRQDYAKTGKIIAWRVTLWDGEKQLAEQKSFLW